MNKGKEVSELKEEILYGRTYGTFSLPEVVVTAKLTFSHKILLRARLINAEAGNEDEEGMIAVGNVIINRAKRKGISERSVIFQRDKKGNPQFDGIDTKRFHKPPQRKHIIAAMKADIIKIVPETVEFFHNPVSSTDTGWINYIEKYTYKDIGNHRFCHNPKRLK